MKTVRVVAAVIRKDDKIFATQRGYGEFKDGWEFPGGKIEDGETPEQALAREIREETGMTVSSLTFNRTQFFEPSNTLMCNFTAFVNDDSELSTNEEIDSYRWFTPDEARENILQNSLASYFLNAYLDESTNL